MRTPAATAPMPPNTSHSFPLIWADFTPAGLPAVSGSAQADEATMLITITRVPKLRIEPPGALFIFRSKHCLGSAAKTSGKTPQHVRPDRIVSPTHHIATANTQARHKKGAQPAPLFVPTSTLGPSHPNPRASLAMQRTGGDDYFFLAQGPTSGTPWVSASLPSSALAPRAMAPPSLPAWKQVKSGRSTQAKGPQSRTPALMAAS